MGSILDALANAEYRQRISLLATLIKLSEADGHIDENEWKIIEKVADNFGFLDKDALKYLKKNYHQYSLDPPFSLDDRIEQLYELWELAFADGKLDDKELRILHRVIISLGFPVNKAEEVFNASLEAFKKGVSKEEFNRLITEIVLHK
ncbi:MAG: hypothetical protein GXO27_01805 [Chlorobi bacterium]|nr:hypothetical protein [Chlorobiota bacterium]